MQHKVLVYGSLRKGGALHDNLTSAECLGFTTVPGRMYQASGWFPAVVTEGASKGELVVGEVYEVDDNLLRVLDGIEGHPNFYERIEVETEEFGTVWIYVWTPDMIDNHRLVESGDWIKEWAQEA